MIPALMEPVYFHVAVVILILPVLILILIVITTWAHFNWGFTDKSKIKNFFLIIGDKRSNREKNKESIVEGLDNLIKRKLLPNKKISEESLIPWKSAILTKVDQKSSKLKTRIKPSKSKPFLKQFNFIGCLKALIICKQCYVEWT